MTEHSWAVPGAALGGTTCRPTQRRLSVDSGDSCPTVGSARKAPMHGRHLPLSLVDLGYYGVLVEAESTQARIATSAQKVVRGRGRGTATCGTAWSRSRRSQSKE